MKFWKERLFRRAREAALEGRLEDAFRLVEQLLQNEPKHSEALRLLADLYRQKGDFDAAEPLYRRLLEEDPHDAVAREGLRQTLIQQGFVARNDEDPLRALERLRAALELDPTDAFVHYNLGNVYADSPDGLENALECWRKAIALRPDYIEPHFDLAQLCVHRGHFAEAISHLEAIVRCRSDWPAPFYLLAVCHVRLGEIEKGLASLKSAVLLNPSWGKTALSDPHLVSLRGNPEFDQLVEVDAVVSLEELHTPEENEELP